MRLCLYVAVSNWNRINSWRFWVALLPQLRVWLRLLQALLRISLDTKRQWITYWCSWSVSSSSCVTHLFSTMWTDYIHIYIYVSCPGHIQLNCYYKALTLDGSFQCWYICWTFYIILIRMRFGRMTVWLHGCVIFYSFAILRTLECSQTFTQHTWHTETLKFEASEVASIIATGCMGSK